MKENKKERGRDRQSEVDGERGSEKETEEETGERGWGTASLLLRKQFSPVQVYIFQVTNNLLLIS